MRAGTKEASWVYTLLGYIVIFLALVVIALLIGAGLYWFLIVPGVRISEQAIVKGIGLAVNTAAISWMVIDDFQSRWRRQKFRWTVTGLLLIHSACFFGLFQYVEHWTVRRFFSITAVEVLLIMYALAWTLGSSGTKEDSEHRSSHGEDQPPP